MKLRLRKNLIEYLITVIIPLALVATGIFLLIIYPHLNFSEALPITSGLFNETIKIPIDFISTADSKEAIEMENILIFQTFESLPPTSFSNWSYIYFGIFLLLFSYLLTFISFLKSYFFYVSTAIISLFLSLCGFNELNIGGFATIYPLLFILTITILPLYLIYLYFKNINLTNRFIIFSTLLTFGIGILLWNTNQSEPFILLSENFILPAILISTFFLIYIGYVFVASLSVLLFKLNQGVGIKISWHIIIIFIIWLAFLIIQMMKLTGEISIDLPIVPAQILTIIIGIAGYFILKLKIQQINFTFLNSKLIQSLYLIGLAFTLLTWGKVDLTKVQPLSLFLSHIFYYGQIAVGTLFFIYILANFSSLLNRGRPLHLVLFKPQFLSFFHLRIGSIMALVILIVYNNVIISDQITAGRIHNTADYYYQTDKPLQAGILYELAWEEYKQNDKAKSASIHLLLNQNQPSLALENLLQSFDYAPNVPNILLLSKMLVQQNKPLEALFYLEKGLGFFPKNNYLLNNKALVHIKLNQIEKAKETLLAMSEFRNIQMSNLIALSSKFKLNKPNDLNAIQKDPIGIINQLAIDNQNGNFSDFNFPFSSLPQNDLLKAAAYLNQWSNKSDLLIDEDLKQIDSLISNTIAAIPAQFLHEAKIIRTQQEGLLNLTLKNIKGTAAIFDSSSGYYLFLSSQLHWKHLDFKKAGFDYLLAVDKGFKNIKPIHLVYLYFGGYPIEAVLLHKKYEIEFPEFMQWDTNGKLIPNEKIKYFEIIGKFHESSVETLLSGISEVNDERLHADLLQNILRYKSHWLNEQTIKEIVKKIAPFDTANIPADDWIKLLKHGELSGINDNLLKVFQLNKNLSFNKNAYYAPLVMLSFAKEKDELKKYEILQEAIQFNKDPILNLAYINQSEKIGLANYGQEILVEIQSKLSKNEIEDIMKKFFSVNN